MGPQELAKTAYTVECFFNALRMHDGRARTEAEEKVVRWLASGTGKENYVVYNLGNIYFYRGGSKPSQSVSLPDVKEGRAIWCDGRKLSLLDASMFEKAGKLVMLGTAGLILTMPGTGAAA
ncbi:MAG: hypothetical protein QG616_1342, partial [Pseudomonadota bacterium]|nr:hypothetical protein [Pseudomonadota bacterium]